MILLALHYYFLREKIMENLMAIITWILKSESVKAFWLSFWNWVVIHYFEIKVGNKKYNLSTAFVNYFVMGVLGYVIFSIRWDFFDSVVYSWLWAIVIPFLIKNKEDFGSYVAMKLLGYEQQNKKFFKKK